MNNFTEYKKTKAHKGVIELWPQLVPLDTPTHLPDMNLSLFPSWVKSYAEGLVSAVETRPELVGTVMLGTLAGVIGRLYDVETGHGHTEPCCLYTLSAMDSGSRKSKVINECTAPIIKWQRAKSIELEPAIKKALSEAKTMEGRVSALRKKANNASDEETYRNIQKQVLSAEEMMPRIPNKPDIFIEDCTPEKLAMKLQDNDERTTLISSEGAFFDDLARYSGGVVNLNVCLKAHCGDPLKIDRVSSDPVYLERPLMSIIITPQPSVLTDLSSKPILRERGLLARFLCTVPKPVIGTRTHEGVPVPEKAKCDYEKNIKKLLDREILRDGEGYPTNRVLKLAPKALEYFKHFQRELEFESSPGRPLEHFTDFSSKAAGASARIAGIFHVTKHIDGRPDDIPIDAATMKNAIELMRTFIEHTTYTLSIASKGGVFSAAQHLLAWIKRHGKAQFTQREAFKPLRRSPKFNSMEDLRAAFNVLEDRGYLEIVHEDSFERGRPKSPTVIVRPEIFKSHR